MITTTILRDICARLQGNESITKLSPSQLNLATIELEILERDNILLICSSVSSELEIYDKLKNKYSNDTIDYENSLGERLFHSFICLAKCAARLYLRSEREFFLGLRNVLVLLSSTKLTRLVTNSVPGILGLSGVSSFLALHKPFLDGNISLYIFRRI